MLISKTSMLSSTSTIFYPLIYHTQDLLFEETLTSLKMKGINIILKKKFNQSNLLIKPQYIPSLEFVNIIYPVPETNTYDCKLN